MLVFWESKEGGNPSYYSSLSSRPQVLECWQHLRRGRNRLNSRSWAYLERRLGIQKWPWMPSQMEGLFHSGNFFTFTSKNKHPYSSLQEQLTLHPVLVSAGPLSWTLAPRRSPPSSAFLMASSSLAPSPQTTIMPLQPKRKLCSSTLPPLQLLLSLLLPQTSYTNAHASSLSFSSAPPGIWLLSLPLSPKPQPPPNYQTQGLLL